MSSAVLFLLACTGIEAAAGEGSGSIRIVTATSKALVRVDGQKVGHTPISDPVPLSAGDHVVKVTKPGHTSFLEVIRVEKGKTRTLEIDLFPIKGVLRVSSDKPASRVYVDGKFMGRAPVELELSPGSHSVRVSLLGHKDVIRHFTSKEGRVARLKAVLVPLETSTPVVVATPVKRKEKFYQKWWFWTSIAGGVVALAISVVVPIALRKEDPTRSFNPDRSLLVR